jgi:hypothetical protein
MKLFSPDWPLSPQRPYSSALITLGQMPGTWRPLLSLRVHQECSHQPALGCLPCHAVPFPDTSVRLLAWALPWLLLLSASGHLEASSHGHVACHASRTCEDNKPFFPEPLLCLLLWLHLTVLYLKEHRKVSDRGDIQTRENTNHLINTAITTWLWGEFSLILILKW